jgi:hypothetical protein
MRLQARQERVIAVVNTAAGGTGAHSIDRMRHALQRLGIHRADVVSFDFDNGHSQLRELGSREHDFLLVRGGDGTHRTALNATGLKPSRLVLLPGGTMNLLSRSLHGSAPWDKALQTVLAAPMSRLLPAGEVDGERFFCALLAGAPARFAQARESLRHGELGRAMGECKRRSRTRHRGRRIHQGWPAPYGEVCRAGRVVPRGPRHGLQMSQRGICFSGFRFGAAHAMSCGRGNILGRGSTDRRLEWKTMRS